MVTAKNTPKAPPAVTTKSSLKISQTPSQKSAAKQFRAVQQNSSSKPSRERSFKLASQFSSSGDDEEENDDGEYGDDLDEDGDQNESDALTVTRRQPSIQQSKTKEKKIKGRVLSAKNYSAQENLAGLEVYYDRVLMNIENRRQDSKWEPVLQAMAKVSQGDRSLNSVKSHFETMIRQVQMACSLLSEDGVTFPEFISDMTDEEKKVYEDKTYVLGVEVFDYMKTQEFEKLVKPKLIIKWYNQQCVILLVKIIIEQMDWDASADALLNGNLKDDARKASKERGKEKKEQLERERKEKALVRGSLTAMAGAADRMATAMENIISQPAGPSSSGPPRNTNQLDRIEEKLDAILEFLRRSSDA